ncbi:hypothetical protein [uncultured Psychrobacter sp.]|uniref:hypothetical protein n=1 Tax=uncultured Psychrobacter sp. TaxID=259303 RepID=UPI0030D719B1
MNHTQKAALIMNIAAALESSIHPSGIMSNSVVSKMKEYTNFDSFERYLSVTLDVTFDFCRVEGIPYNRIKMPIEFDFYKCQYDNDAEAWLWDGEKFNVECGFFEGAMFSDSSKSAAYSESKWVYDHEIEKHLEDQTPVKFAHTIRFQAMSKAFNLLSTEDFKKLGDTVFKQVRDKAIAVEVIH